MDVQNFLMFYLPNKLNIHIQDWALTFGTIIKAIVVTSTISIFMKILKEKELKNEIVFPCTLFFFFSYIILLEKTRFIDFIIYEGFFRFTIPSLLLLIFSYKFYNFLEKKNENKNALSILGIITASSSEICAIILIISTFLYGVYLTFSKKEVKKKIYSIIPIFLSLILGLIILINSNGFQENIQDKFNNTSINLNINFAIISEFTKLFLEKIILDYLPIHILVLIFVLLNFKTTKNKLENFYPISLIFSIIIFSYSFIFLGKTSYSENYWLVHKDFYTIFIPTFLFSFSILLSNYLSIQKGNLNTKKLLCCFILIGFLLFPQFCDAVSFIKKSNNNIKQHSYIRDKIRLFYLYKNQVPTMPYFASFEAFFSLVKNHDIAFGDNVTTKKQIPTMHYERLEKHYFNNTYDVEIKPFAQQINLTTDKQALNTFKENGGNIDEIYKNKYNFSDLKNKNFVINNKNNI